MLHLENEALMHGQRLHEAADHARLVAEARGPRPSLFSLLAGPLFHRRSAPLASAPQPVQSVRISARMAKQDAV